MDTHLPKLGTPSRQAAVSMAIVYWLVTIEMLMRRQKLSSEFAGEQQGVIGRLVRDGWLTGQWIAEGLRVFRLTPQAAYRAGLPSHRGKLLGSQAQVDRLPTALDCERRGIQPFDSLTVQQGFLSRICTLSTVFCPGQHAPVVRLIVDHGKDPGKLARKIVAISREMMSACSRHVVTGDFGIRVLVPSKAKAQLVARRFDYDRPAGDCIVEFGEVVELQSLLLTRQGSRRNVSP